MPTQLISPTFTYKDVKILNRDIVYRGYFALEKITITHSLFKGGQSKPVQREVFQRGNAAGVLLYDPHVEKIVFVEQFRIGVIDAEPTQSPWLYEIVAGIVEPGETPEAVVKREALEEANATIVALKLIASYWVSPGGSTEHCTLFCGQIQIKNEEGIFGNVKESEDIRIHCIDVSDALIALEKNQITNAHTLIALQWFGHKKNELKKEWTKKKA